MKNRALALAAAILLTGSGMAMAQYYGPPAPPPQYGPGYGQGGWEQAPPEFREAEARGFRDGIDGAKKDFKNHRPPNVMNRDEYRDPHFIAPPDRRDYLIGFRRGYEVAVHHIYGSGYARYAAPGY